MLDGVYVDMAQGLVLGLKPKPEFLPLFNLGEPVTTGDSELVIGGMEQSWAPNTRTPQQKCPTFAGCQYTFHDFTRRTAITFSAFPEREVLKTLRLQR
jgi:hypothetical protein